jgi:membrane protease YdiL (CAAX protease family)
MAEGGAVPTGDFQPIPVAEFQNGRRFRAGGLTHNNPMRRKRIILRAREVIFPLLAEFVLYAVFVFAYFFLVLHYLGNWLKELARHKYLYAVIALALIIAQGLFLEILTVVLLKLVRRKRK